MTRQKLDEIIDKAAFIVGGYAFVPGNDDTVSIIDLSYPHHVSVVDKAGEIIETNMDDIEISIVLGKYWSVNRKYLADYA